MNTSVSYAHIQSYMYAHIHNHKHANKHIPTYVCVHMSLCFNICIRMFTQKKNVLTYVVSCESARACVCVCVCVYASVRVCMCGCLLGVCIVILRFWLCENVFFGYCRWVI